MDRSCGTILPIYALPTAYGVGTLGREAREFVDFLSESGQTWWQMLPVGPTSYGDSPYQSPSTFAGNPYFIDLDYLVEDGLLTREEVEAVDWGDDPSKVDYALLFQRREPLLRRAFERGRNGNRRLFEEFVVENDSWLADYALFMAVKRRFDLKPWIEWPDDGIRLREKDAVARYASELADEIEFYEFEQFLFYTQWEQLKRYAHAKGIKVLGDLPIYQLWGNPLYDYDTMEKDGFAWWVNRIKGAANLYDSIRIDHFRGIESYWAVPYGDKTARNGRWVKGPGMKLVGTLEKAFPNVSFIAEDLGYTTPEVRQLLADSGMPGMKVLELGFDSRDVSDYLPHAFSPHCVCYTGTHDNQTIEGWGSHQRWHVQRRGALRGANARLSGVGFRGANQPAWDPWWELAVEAFAGADHARAH